jgi:hypothetical protein
MVVSMRIILAIVLCLVSNIALAQWGGGGGGTVNNTAANTNRVLCSIRSANFNSTADQACAIAAAVTVYSVTSILVTNCSTSLTLAAGGVYSAASKAGTALVAAAQVYTALTGSSVVLSATLAANIATTRYTAAILYLSLTTGQGSAATCDFYVIGNDLT